MIHDQASRHRSIITIGNLALKGDAIINDVTRDSTPNITGVLCDVVPNDDAAITNKNSHCGNVYK